MAPSIAVCYGPVSGGGRTGGGIKHGIDQVRVRPRADHPTHHLAIEAIEHG